VFGADVEDLNDAPGVGGDAREIGTVENRPLQGPGLEQGLFGLLARRDIAQHAGEVTLPPSHISLAAISSGKDAAILAPADHLAPETDRARFGARL
jgi:hypothetical protein